MKGQRWGSDEPAEIQTGWAMGEIMLICSIWLKPWSEGHRGKRCLLMHTVWTADLVSVCSDAHGCRTRLFGAHHSANDTSLRALLWWPETWMTWAVSAQQELVWRLWETGRGWAAWLCCYTVPCHSKGPRACKNDLYQCFILVICFYPVNEVMSQRGLLPLPG